MNEIRMPQVTSDSATRAGVRFDQDDESRLEELFYSVVPPARASIPPLHFQQGSYLNPEDLAADIGQMQFLAI